LINSFNLIDGINGLCGSVSAFILCVAGAWFFSAGDAPFALLALTSAGGTLAFLKYNISSKVFMGDTGSLVLGTICTLLVIRFMETASVSEISGIASVSTIALGLLMLPAFDTVRVFALRLWQGRSPFEADKTHLHHLLLQTGLSHLQSSAILLSVSIGFFVLSISLQGIDPTSFLILAALLSVVFTVCVHFAISLQTSSTLRTDP